MERDDRKRQEENKTDSERERQGNGQSEVNRGIMQEPLLFLFCPYCVTVMD